MPWVGTKQKDRGKRQGKTKCHQATTQSTPPFHQISSLPGHAQLCLTLVPEVARLARRWDLTALQEALASTVASEEGGLSPEVWEFVLNMFER